jgi:hypothetical protein
MVDAVWLEYRIYVNIMKEKPRRVSALVYGKALSTSLRNSDRLQFAARVKKSKIAEA